MTNSTHSHSVFTTALRIVAVNFLFFLCHPAAMAQRSATDGTTPLALSPGAPAGSYALSGFETINEYNGNLNFKLPLLQIGGRGSASYVLSLPIESHWRTVHKSNEFQTIELPVLDWWNLHLRRYGVGQLQGRLGVDPEHPCVPHFTTTLLSRMTFTAG